MAQFANGASLAVVRSLLNATGLRKNTHNASRAPTATDDTSGGWEVGSKWINTSSTPPASYECISNAAGAAVWAISGNLIQVTITNATNAAGRTLANYRTPNTDIVLNPGSEGGVIIGVPPSKGNRAAVNIRVTVRQRGNAVVMTYHDDAAGRRYEMLYVDSSWGPWTDVTPYAPAARATVAADSLGGIARNFNNMTATDTTWIGAGSSLFSNAPPNTANAYITGQWQTFDLGPMLVQRVWFAANPAYAFYERYYDKTALSWSIWSQPNKIIPSGPVLVCFGDSITAGVGVGANNANGYALRTASLLNSPITRLATAGRCMSGTTAGDFIPALDLAANAAAISAAEVIWIAYGTNDWGQSVPLGSVADTENGTFYGAMKEGLTKLRVLNPTARVAFLTPIYRGKAYSSPLDWSEAGENSLGLTVENYRQAIRTFVAREGLALSEMSFGSEINEMTASTYLPTDALHPGAMGHRYMADSLAARLKTWGWAA